MATIAGIMNLAAPKFSENMDVRDAAAIRSYLYQMQEQLGYILTNLDTSNFAPEMQMTGAQVAAASSRAAIQAAQVREMLGQMDAQFGAVAAGLTKTAGVAADQPAVMALRAAPAAAESSEAAMAEVLRDCFANLQKQVKETRAKMEKAEKAQPAQDTAAVAAAVSKEVARRGRGK